MLINDVPRLDDAEAAGRMLLVKVDVAGFGLFAAGAFCHRQIELEPITLFVTDLDHRWHASRCHYLGSKQHAFFAILLGFDPLELGNIFCWLAARYVLQLKHESRPSPFR